MNRRALLQRLPFLAALPWLAREVVKAAVSPVPPSVWGESASYRAKRLREEWWPPGDGWEVTDVLWSCERGYAHQRTTFRRHVGWTNTRIEAVVHEGPATPWRRAGDRKPGDYVRLVIENDLAGLDVTR